MERAADPSDLLRRLDDPEWVEFPAGWSAPEAADSFARLAARIIPFSRLRCETEKYYDDTALYGRIDVPDKATVRGTSLVVLVSKFQPLAMVAAENPGAFLGTDEAIAEGKLDAGDLAKAEQALAETGYVAIPEEVLSSRYDGFVHLDDRYGAPTWWDRFFEYF